MNMHETGDWRLTEKDSPHRNLELKSTRELLLAINEEDQKVAQIVAAQIDDIERLVEQATLVIESGGRVFYIGAGTSGRLGILDASECPPTFGVGDDWIIGIIAGGDQAIRKAVEGAEDDEYGAWKDLLERGAAAGDLLIGIAASGTTPYVIGGLQEAKVNGLKTGCITCNPSAPMLKIADFPVCIPTGPEFLTGSTRMKAGTAQKMVLNMISTATMIKLGRVRDNKMVDMALTNDKLVDRGVRMIMQHFNMNYDDAKELLLAHGSVRKAMNESKIC
jgi:N-acetylmuramic acid 6-phosphate etherase